MNPFHLVRQLQAAGVRFRVIPGPLVRLQMIDPWRISTGEQRRQLSAARLDVIALLSETATTTNAAAAKHVTANDASSLSRSDNAIECSHSRQWSDERITEFLEERSAIAEYDGLLTRESAEAQARADLLALQQIKQQPVSAGPRQSKNKIHMFTTTGTLTNDPAKCYMWTREEYGFGWWHASRFPPPAW